MQDLVAGTYGTPLAAIVVGVIDDVALVVEEATPTPDATIEAHVGATLFPQDGLKYTYLHLRPEQVLLTDGHVQTGLPILLAMAGTYAEPMSPSLRQQYPAPQIGERFLYFLTYEESKYGVEDLVYDSDRGQYSRLIVEGDEVTYSDGDRSPVQFAVGTPPSAFIDAVATAVATQYP